MRKTALAQTLETKQLSNVELLTILFQEHEPNQLAEQAAISLVGRFKSLRNLCDAPAATITASTNINSNHYVNKIQAALTLAERYYCDKVQHEPLLNEKNNIQGFLCAKLRHLKYETFACVYLDSQFNLLNFEKLQVGSVNRITLYPRRIIERALLHNATQVIFAHNHPQGAALPSPADRETTIELKKLLATIDVNVLDHFIIGSDAVFAFSEHGLLS